MPPQKATTEQLYEDYAVRRLPLRVIAQKYGYANAATASKVISLRGIPHRGRQNLLHFKHIRYKMPDAKLSDAEWQIMCGGLLGDASALMSANHAIWCSAHSVKVADYTYWLADHISRWVSKVIVVKHRYSERVPVASDTLRVQTITHPEFLRLRNLFYPGGVKHVPDGILSGLDERALAVLLMDDGSYNKSNRNVQLSCECFPIDEQEMLREWFAGFGLKTSSVRCSTGVGRRVNFSATSMNRLRELVLPHFAPCMYYKLGC